MKKYLMIISFVIVLICSGCKKTATVSINDQLKGQWVRNDIKTDTLVFGYLSLPWVQIKRGYETINGFKTQKISGWYDYRLKNDSISLTWIASSAWSEKWYSININDTKMDIGDFIDSTNTILIFEKIK